MPDVVARHDAGLGGCLGVSRATPRRGPRTAPRGVPDDQHPRRDVGADWLFAGHREFLIDPQPDGTVLFTHVEDVSGLLFPLFRALMGGAIQRHHEGLNGAVKERAEGRR